jgi:hypothetical protein
MIPFADITHLVLGLGLSPACSGSFGYGRVLPRTCFSCPVQCHVLGVGMVGLYLPESGSNVAVNALKYAIAVMVSWRYPVHVGILLAVPMVIMISVPGSAKHGVLFKTPLACCET